MIILDSTTRSLEAKLGGAITTNQLPIVASYVDVTTTTYVPGSNNTQSNGATPVTAVAAPAASTQRQVKLLTVYNKDTVDAVLTIQYNDNATIREIVSITLDPGDTLIYTDGEGFRVIDSAGSIKSGGGGISTHALLDPAGHTDSVIQAPTRGSLIFANSTPKWDELAIGSSDYVLRSDGTDLGWAAITAGMLPAITQIGTAISSSDFSTSSITLVDVTGMSVSMTTTGGSTLTLVTVPARMNAAGNSGMFDFNLDGVDAGSIKGITESANDETVTLFRYNSGLSAAAHTFKLRARVNNGAHTLTCSMSSLMNGTMIVIEFKK